MIPSGNEPPKPRLTLRRRLNDFSSRPRGMSLMQAGTTTTCCCCCLHWIGAATGAILGSVAATRSAKKEPLTIHPKVKSYVVRGTWLGFLAVVVLVIGVVVYCDTTNPSGPVIESALYALIFVPSIASLLVGAGAIVGGWLARSVGTSPPAQDGETINYGSGGGLRLAWRIAWQTFLYSTLFSGVGYFVMVVIAAWSRQ